MGEGLRLINFAKFFLVSVALLGIITKELFADTALVCDGKLEKHTEADGVYFAPKDFKSLRIVPNSNCGPETECTYDIVIRSGNNRFKEKSRLLTKSLCDATEFNDKIRDTTSDQTPDEFGLEKNITTYIVFMNEDNEYFVQARSIEHLVNDVEESTGVWHGDNSGGAAWQVYTREEQILSGNRSGK